MKKYVVGFFFTPDMKSVWLITKQKPEWQKGCLNGIGGKIEDTDVDAHAAMIREIKEEADVNLGDIAEIIHLGHMTGTNNDGSSFHVDIFTGRTDAQFRTMEQELIDLYPVDEVGFHKSIGNVPMLIEACIYRMRNSSSFSKLIMEY